jgi:hypothetical protein
VRAKRQFVVKHLLSAEQNAQFIGEIHRSTIVSGSISSTPVPISAASILGRKYSAAAITAASS